MNLIDKLREKLGDFWYYSLMLFLALRVADFLNMFVGLYVVPKYIDPSELGAVLPLISFATTLALPAYVFSLAFSKEVNTLAVHREFGRLKSLMRGVFLAVGLVLIAAIGISRLLLPVFLEKIRVVEGSLGILILASAFLSCAAPIYTNALQALKKFTALSLLNVIAAPVRLLTMLLAMPFRPLSGYFVGQGASPFAQIFLSIFFLRKVLAVKAAPYWSKATTKKLFVLFVMMALYQFPSMISSLVDSTILREYLSDVDSAAYYMITRFSDITNYIAITLVTILFPMTAEAAEEGRSTKPLMMKAFGAQIVFSLLLATFFLIFGKSIFMVLPNGSDYLEYVKFIPILIGANTLLSIQLFYTNTEASANRWRFLYWWIPLNAALPSMLVALAHHGNIRSFEAIVAYLVASSLAKSAIVAVSVLKMRSPRE
ncbi:MAG: hypothetical protein MJ109_06535 [Kiritimatiellae bacterium]|nr:hypothetical protein [Kiritimatiellia bacterium]